jgi:anti-sigma28 factor (negative regulator of flagellin synthesis)
MASDVRLALTHIPEIRIERVESLRRLLAEGKFCVEGEVVAERLLTGVM